VLVDALEATHVSVGENFRFGNQAKGTPELLAADSRFSTRIVPLVEAEDEIVSSSHIRGLILAGDVGEAATLLGAPFQLRGTVVHGDERGRTLGYPTANLVPDERYVYPAHGVYAARAEVPGRGAWTAAVNVGVRPTFVTGRGVLVEAYLLDFQGDLYDEELRLEFLARLRGERRFETVEALAEQMGRDVEDTRRAATLDRP
jgi:riboflavin kinase / FMN adenylyltransferase